VTRSGNDVVALIPARGGSKSIPRKNLRPLGGHPLIAWTIAAARESSRVGEVIVSTDDEEIRSVAAEYGAEAPFLRPAALAQDDTPDHPVFLHALWWLETDRGRKPDVVVHLRPTSPLRPAGLVDEAIARLAANPEADSLRSVTPAGQNPFKMWTREERWLKPLLGPVAQELFNQPRQKLPLALWQTGHVDVIRRRTLLDLASMTGRRILGFEVDSRHAVDIDTPDQWVFAEWLIACAELELVRPLPLDAGR
jgi:CMP-N-acetylneuraminic acid synthetase